MKTAFILLIIFSVINVFSQPTLKWTSPIQADSTEIGWFNIRNNPVDSRFYVYDQSSNEVQIMTSSMSTTPSYTIQLSNDEYLGQLSWNNCDYTGDGLNDIIISKWYGVGSSGRGAMRVVDISNGTNIFVLDNSLYDYRWENGSDIDSDGKIEMIIRRTNVSNYEIDYLVYSTNGIPSSVLNDIGIRPDKYRLEQNYPNPFNPSTTIKYQIPEAGNAEINIYDINSELIRTFNQQHNSSGEYSITWDGKNNNGQQVSSNVYFYQLVINNVQDVKKMVMLK